MKKKFKVLNHNRAIPLDQAISSGIINIQHDSLQAKENTDLLLSTELFDDNNSEIYENDIVIDAAGSIFKIIFLNGAFFAFKINQSGPEKLLPLYLLQSNGHIPVKIYNK